MEFVWGSTSQEMKNQKVRRSNRRTMEIPITKIPKKRTAEKPMARKDPKRKKRNLKTKEELMEDQVKKENGLAQTMKESID